MRFLKYLGYIILILGIALRLSVYFQNRNLFQDEANIARNVYERDYSQLTAQLSYYQYASPLFLWALKLLTTILGYSEYVFRFISLISGIGSIVFTYILLGRFGVKKALWYPLFLLSTGFIYIRYSTELKQYSFDSFIALGLIYLALYIEPKKLSAVNFFALWFLVGSFAIWSSMPSVFILAGIGAYYFSLLDRKEYYKHIYSLAFVAIVWLIQFGIYYETILRPQIQSDYLQIFHKEGFLLLFPKTKSDLIYNWSVLLNVLEAATGSWFYAIKLHLLFIVVALYFSIRQMMSSILLLIGPILLLLLAASLHQYALTPRIVLFIMPLLLILIGIGFEKVFAYRYLRFGVLGLSFICMYKFSELEYFYIPLQIVQVADGMDFLVKQNIRGDQLHVDYLAYPAYTYYTVINPCNKSWETIKNAAPLNYVRFDSLSQIRNDTMAILYGSAKIKLADSEKISKHLTMLKHYPGLSCQAYIYGPN